MNYFEEVYLKRVNRFGHTIQDRIHGEMAHDFENKLKKSPNRITMFKTSTAKKVIGCGIVEQKERNDERVTNYLCTRLRDRYDTGFCFTARRPYTKEYQNWMIAFQEEYQTIGYNRYQILLLDDEVTWIDNEGNVHKSPVHCFRKSDADIKDVFKFGFLESVAYIPHRILELSMPYTDKLTRGMRLIIGDTTWRVACCDNVSVKGVSYIGLEEDYEQNGEIADEEKLEKWEVVNSCGGDIVSDGVSPISFVATYDGLPTDQPLKIDCAAAAVTIAATDDGYVFSGENGSYTVFVTILSANITKQFNLVINNQQQAGNFIVGPEKLKVLQTLKYNINSDLTDYSYIVESANNHFSLDRIENEIFYLTGDSIGEDVLTIKIKVNDEIIDEITKNINVISSWM